MKIKKDDMVKVISGKDRGKAGKVLWVLKDKNRAIVEGLCALNLLLFLMRFLRRGWRNNLSTFTTTVFSILSLVTIPIFVFRVPLLLVIFLIFFLL